MTDLFTTDLFLVPLVGVMYVVFFSALSYMRREGVSRRFVAESLVVTALLTVGAVFTGSSLYPLVALVVLYVVTMRCRIALDLANTLARRGRLPIAQRLYALATSLFPDDLTRVLVGINHGTALLLHGEPAQAQALIEGVMANSGEWLPPKYEAAARYNLGVAYRRQGQEDRARQEFQLVTGLMPESTTYHVRAQRALEWKSPTKP